MIDDLFSIPFRFPRVVFLNIYYRSIHLDCNIFLSFFLINDVESIHCVFPILYNINFSIGKIIVKK